MCAFTWRYDILFRKVRAKSEGVERSCTKHGKMTRTSGAQMIQLHFTSVGDEMYWCKLSN